MDHPKLSCPIQQGGYTLKHGKYVNYDIWQVMDRDLCYVEELIIEGIYVPSMVAIDKMRRQYGSLLWDGLLLDDEDYYQTDQHG